VQPFMLSFLSDLEIVTRASRPRDVNRAQLERFKDSNFVRLETVRKIVSSVIVLVSLKSKLVKETRLATSVRAGAGQPSDSGLCRACKQEGDP
jgi:hypothetical protein